MDFNSLLWFETDHRCSPVPNAEITSCNSHSTGAGYEGDTCNFTCNSGYQLTGSETRTCHIGGNWIDNDDVCRRGMHNSTVMAVPLI